MSQEKRREPRHAIRFPAHVHWRGRRYLSMVEDVSFRGMRLRTDALPPLRMLVRVELQLPDEQRSLTLHAMVAHATLQADCPQPAVGLELYGIAQEERAVWEGFVQRVAMRDGESRLRPSCIAAVHPSSDTALRLLRAHAASGSRIYLDTAWPVTPGQTIHAAVVHPDDDSRVHLLEVTVHRCVDTEDRRGAIVNVRRLHGAPLEALTEFIQRQSRAA